MRTTSAALAAPLVALLLPLAGCPAPTGPQVPSCEPDEEVEAGTLVATIDGEEFLGDATMNQLQPTGLMLGFTQDANNQMTLRLMRSSVYSIEEETERIVVDEGDPVADIWNGGVAPSDFSLGDSANDGGDVTLVHDSETLHTSNAADEGFLRFTEFRVDEDAGTTTLFGCGWFDAESQSNDVSARVEDLSFTLSL